MLNNEFILDSKVYNEPFQHFYVDGNVFSEDFYQTLINNLPDISHYNPLMHPEAILDDNYSSRDMFILTKDKSVELSKNINPIWGKLFNIIDSDDFKKLIFCKLKGDIEERHGKSFNDIECRTEIQIIRDSLGYKILPHPDGMMKYVSCLIYLPEDDSHKHLGTNIYKESNSGEYTGTSGKGNEATDFSNKKFELVRKCPFKPNSMTAFAVSNKKSWHGVDEMNEKYTRNCIQIFFCSQK
tara:strand:+ start:528 stop:1247 length:720 start_codon:yes stop_codon:yes gene_type:complete